MEDREEDSRFANGDGRFTIGEIIFLVMLGIFIIVTFALLWMTPAYPMG